MRPDLTSLNREAWLQAATEVYRDSIAAPAGIQIPEIRVSVGLPHARNQRDVLVQLFKSDQTADRIPQLFVNPLLSDGVKVLTEISRVLYQAYHGPVADSAALLTSAEINLILETLGPYPQASILLPEVTTQPTRMIKMTCPKCGYLARATSRWLSAHGPLYCPCRFNRTSNTADLVKMSRADIPF